MGKVSFPSLSFLFLLVFLLAAVCSCTPYSSEFRCPQPYLGECMSLPDAYKKSVSGYQPPKTQKEAEQLKAKQQKKRKSDFWWKRGGEEKQCKSCVPTPSSQPSRPSDQVGKTGSKTLTAEGEYKRIFLSEVAAMLKEPRAPIVSPPKVMRILILPYTEANGVLYQAPHYVYVIVEQPKFILDSKLLSK